MIEYYNDRIQRYEEYDTIIWWMLKPHNNYFRKIRTTQEIRENKKALEEKNFYGYKVRGKRMGHNLPCAWDDIGSSKSDCKGWKDLYRVKKQYLKPKLEVIS